MIAGNRAGMAARFLRTPFRGEMIVRLVPLHTIVGGGRWIDAGLRPRSFCLARPYTVPIYIYIELKYIIILN